MGRRSTVQHRERSDMAMSMSAFSSRTSRLGVCPTSRRAPCDRRAVRMSATAVGARPVPRWPDVYQFLVQQQLKTISPEEASSLLETGEYVLVDVRTPSQFEASHPAGAISVPMYQEIDFSKGADLVKVIKTVAYRFNGITPVELNPEFSALLRKACDNGAKGIITICEAGGTMKPSVNFPEGKASRSLQATYVVLNDKVTDRVLHVERGVYGWFQSDLPMEGDYKPELGRTPMAAAEPTLKQINQERGYEMKEGDKPLDAKKWPWG